MKSLILSRQNKEEQKDKQIGKLTTNYHELELDKVRLECDLKGLMNDKNHLKTAIKTKEGTFFVYLFKNRLIILSSCQKFCMFIFTNKFMIRRKNYLKYISYIIFISEIF